MNASTTIHGVADIELEDIVELKVGAGIRFSRVLIVRDGTPDGEHKVYLFSDRREDLLLDKERK